MQRILTAMALLLAMTTLAGAQQQQDYAAKFMAKLTSSLGLTQAQQSQAQPMVNALIEKGTARNQALRQELRSTLTPDQLKTLRGLLQAQRGSGQQPEVVNLLNQLNLTDPQIDKLQPFLDQQKKEREAARSEFFQQFTQILTPQQRQGLQQFRQSQQGQN